MNDLPIQPRLARLLLAGQELGITRLAAIAAACLSERDIFDRNSGGPREGSSPNAMHGEMRCYTTSARAFKLFTGKTE